MTAEIGIFNKSAIVLAADSAQTVNHSFGSKAWNTANKIFNLSKYHPVGIMVYASGSFLEIPWELIVKEYRKKLGDNSFRTLEEYKTDFISFLKTFSSHSRPEIDKWIVRMFVGIMAENVKFQTGNGEWKSGEETGDFQKFFTRCESELRSQISIWENKETLAEFNDYDLSTFIQSYLTDIEDALKMDFNGIPIIPESITELFGEFAYLASSKDWFFESYSGVVITGYGDDEIFPHTFGLTVGAMIDGRLRYTEHSHSIDHENIMNVVPFAQTDVANMFLYGIDPQIENEYQKAIYEAFDIYNQELVKKIPIENQAATKAGLDKVSKVIIEDLLNRIENFKLDKHIQPIISSVSALSKEDMIELAESLIQLTSIKKRVTEQIDDVGGPIDIAVITKGDGFIWIKRKHYFKKELNLNYLTRYYNGSSTGNEE